MHRTPLRIGSPVLATLLLVALGCGGPAADRDAGSPPVPTASPDNESENEGGPPFPNAEEFQRTDSGLKYHIVREGDGPKPAPSDTVRVHYRGMLEDGTVFDSSYESNQPAEFGLGGVIAGWTEGLQLIGEGGQIELIIPPELGYGEQGSGAAIPPGATLYFTVELLEVK